MKQIATVTTALAVAFGAGFGAAHLSAPAAAASAPLTAQAIDLAAITTADLKPTGPGSPVSAKGLVAQDGMTLGVQIGPAPKHFHADANEFQYVIDGTGTEWLGDKQVALKPGMLLIIPKGTTHGGSVETTGHLKLIAIKTPPQAPDDTHPVP
jgi:mannose-6-phosphate isomerase-like protein (cupin superfamily)